MTFNEFKSLVASNPNGVILLEGRREIPEEAAKAATQLAQMLTESFPSLRFRSGNAPGSDEAFSNGVAAIDPTRLELVAPYSGHRKKFQYDQATYHSPESLTTVAEEEVIYKTNTATPKNKGLIEQFRKSGRAASKAKYLVRDTMKVTGFSEDSPKPICALFYADPIDPMKGGTGHTLRVCKQENVPTVLQSNWMKWL